MHSVTIVIHFSYGHRLLNYKGKCARLHGHNGRVHIEVASEMLDGRWMVMDFNEIRKGIGKWIDENLDHKMVLSEKDSLAAVLQSAGEPVLVIPEDPTAEIIARLLFRECRKKRIPVSKVTLWETETSYAAYHE